ncbi:hypothetical protein [Streptomyces sp. NPDC007100]|uniref:hypothetical protein n=1 Tax=unclassified Streptomyces TaxID=2593676 RepID=UPI0033C6A64F
MQVGAPFPPDCHEERKPVGEYVPDVLESCEYPGRGRMRAAAPPAGPLRTVKRRCCPI